MKSNYKIITLVEDHSSSAVKVLLYYTQTVPERDYDVVRAPLYLLLNYLVSGLMETSIYIICKQLYTNIIWMTFQFKLGS